jgi:hypothetical protein
MKLPHRRSFLHLAAGAAALGGCRLPLRRSTPGGNNPPGRCAIEYAARHSAGQPLSLRGARRADANRTSVAYAGSRLKPLMIREGTAWKASPPAVLGKTRRTE